MPLWLVYHPEGTFTTPESKKSLAADITTFYTGGGLPAFYVVVKFILVPNDDTFIGGENPSPAKPFIRITADHIAVHVQDNERHMASTIKRLGKLLDPHIADKGYDWEFHIDETPRGLWTINGLTPPPWGSAAEKKWFDENKASAWEEPSSPKQKL